jgi:hypothetical protein
MVYDNNNINVTILNQALISLIKEQENFNNVTYSSFKNSYIYNSTDMVIKGISTKLDFLYKEIEHDYTILIKWFSDYLNNIKSIELYLSGEGNLGSISEAELRNYISVKLENLNTYYNK